MLFAERGYGETLIYMNIHNNLSFGQQVVCKRSLRVAIKCSNFSSDRLLKTWYGGKFMAKF